MVEYLISRIGALRTPEWQRDPRRQPAVLPDTFKFRTWLVAYPYAATAADAAGDGATYSASVDTFASELGALIDELAANAHHRPYHIRLSLLEDLAKGASEKDFCRIAAVIGELNNPPTVAARQDGDVDLARLLRIEFANSLLMKAHRPDDMRDVDRVMEVLEGWRGSGDEEVRRRGFETTNWLELRKNNGDPRSVLRGWKREGEV